MLSVSDALHIVMSEVSPLPQEQLDLQDSLGKVLAEDIHAPLSLPRFDSSSMDGFAVRAADLQSASTASPVELPVAGEATAGQPARSLPPGPCCIRIMTGAVLPCGANAVVMQENTVLEPAGTIRFTAPAVPGEFVRVSGEDIRQGDPVIPAGTVIRPAEIAVLAALGLAQIRVIRSPRMALITTGNEVVLPGNPLLPGQIYDANRYMLQALATDAGFQVRTILHVQDEPGATEAILARAAEGSDVVICSGGVSVGAHDHVRGAVERLGCIRFWRVAMKPGKPLVFGRVRQALFFGLPGNPASSMVSFELFVRPALRALAGCQQIYRPRVQSRLLTPIPHTPGREEYARASTRKMGDQFVSRAADAQESHRFRPMITANSLLQIPSERGSVEAGEILPAIMTGWPEI